MLAVRFTQADWGLTQLRFRCFLLDSDRQLIWNFRYFLQDSNRALNASAWTACFCRPCHSCTLQYGEAKSLQETLQLKSCRQLSVSKTMGQIQTGCCSANMPSSCNLWRTVHAHTVWQCRYGCHNAVLLPPDWSPLNRPPAHYLPLDNARRFSS